MESNVLYGTFMPAELILWALVSFVLRRAEPGGLDTTFAGINDISDSEMSSASIKTSERYSINPQTINCSSKLVKYITLFEQRKNLFQKFSYLSTEQLYGNLEKIISLFKHNDS